MRSHNWKCTDGVVYIKVPPPCTITKGAPMCTYVHRMEIKTGWQSWMECLESFPLLSHAYGFFHIHPGMSRVYRKKIPHRISGETLCDPWFVCYRKDSQAWGYRMRFAELHFSQHSLSYKMPLRFNNLDIGGGFPLLQNAPSFSTTAS